MYRDLSGVERARSQDAIAFAGFQRALESDAARMERALHRTHFEAVTQRLGHAEFADVRVMMQRLFSRLRTPVFPKRAHDPIAAGFYQSALSHGRAELHVALASTTAMAEIATFIDLAQTIQAAGLTAEMHVHLVRWENFVDVAHLTTHMREAAFAEAREKVATTLADARLRFVISTIDVAIAGTLAETSGPTDVLGLLALLDSPLRIGDAELGRHRDWITAFYARQRSLQRLGEVQPLVDLAIRTAVGRRAAASCRQHADTHSGACLLLTSELNQRFLPCYGDRIPIANISLGG